MRSATGSRRAAALVLALAAVAAPAAAAPASASRLEARLDRSELALGETAELTVRLESAEPPLELRLPADGPALRVVSRSESTQTQVSYAGGKVTLRQVRVWVLVLAPLRAGQVTVAGPVAVVGGERHAHPDLALTVSGKRAPPAPGAGAAPGGGRPGRDPPPSRPSWRGWEKEMALRLRLDREEAFVGEQVTATLELVTPVEMEAAEELRPPAVEGFWSEPLPLPTGYRIDRVNDIPSYVYVVSKLALFPLRPGELTLGPAELEAVFRIASRRSFGLFPELRRARSKSRPVAVRVKPLPPGAPPGFTPGNVGDWSLSWEGPASPPSAGQPFPLRILARGTGNLRALGLPPVPTLPGLRAFDPSVSDEVKPRGDRLAGTRTVETVVVLEREGTLTLPELEWSFFDPEKGRYETARLPALPLAAGPRAPAARPAAAGVEALALSLRPLRAEGALWPARGPAFQSPLLLGALALPPLAFAALWLGLAVRERRALGEGERRRRRAARVAARRLAGARRRMEAGDAAGFHAETARALFGYAADRLGRPVAGLTRQALAAELTRAGAHGPAVGIFARTLEASDAGRFGGEKRLPELLASAQEAIARLEEAEWAPSGGTR